MSDKVLLEKDGRIGRIILNRPKVLNAIDADVPTALAARVDEANVDPDIHVIVLSGAGHAFCAGYDLTCYVSATEGGGRDVTQEMPCDPMKDYAFMHRNIQLFMRLWHSQKPVVAKIHGYAAAGSSDIALCCDMIVMADDAEIGYMPARVRGCSTTAMWTYRLVPEQAKRMLLTGDRIDGREAERIGLVLRSVPIEDLHATAYKLANRMASVPVNQLMMQKMMINQAIEAMGLLNTQKMATLFDGITRHSPECMNFKARSEEKGWKKAVRERDSGTFDWTTNRPINPKAWIMSTPRR